MIRIVQTVRRGGRRLVGSASGFIASVLRAGLQLSTRLRLIGARNLVGVALLTTLAALLVQRPALALALLGASGLVVMALRVGLRLSLRTSLRIEQRPAVRLLLAAITGTGTLLRAGVRTTLLGVAGVLGLVQLRPALRLAAVIRSYLAPQRPSFEIVRVKYDLTQRKGAASATEANGACGRQDFDTPANATGLRNGTLCTCAGNAVAARCGRLNLAFAATLGKTALTITQVRLHFYYAQTSVLAATCVGGYGFGAGADVQLFSHAALTSPDFLTTANSFDITAAVAGDWARIDSLRTYVTAEIAALALNDSVRVDAVELEVIATATQNV